MHTWKNTWQQVRAHSSTFASLTPFLILELLYYVWHNPFKNPFSIKACSRLLYLPPNAIYYTTQVLQGLVLFYSDLHPGRQYQFYSCCWIQSQCTGNHEPSRGPPKPKPNQLLIIYIPLKTRNHRTLEYTHTRTEEHSPERLPRAFYPACCYLGHPDHIISFINSSSAEN